MENPVPTITISIEETEDAPSWSDPPIEPPLPGPPGPEGGWWTVEGRDGTLARFWMPPLPGAGGPKP